MTTFKWWIGAVGMDCDFIVLGFLILISPFLADISFLTRVRLDYVTILIRPDII